MCVHSFARALTFCVVHAACPYIRLFSLPPLEITRDSASDELYSDDERWGGGGGVGRGGRSASLARRRGGRGYSRDRGQSRDRNPAPAFTPLYL